jgi:hypothetical protein
MSPGRRNHRQNLKDREATIVSLQGLRAFGWRRDNRAKDILGA